MSHRLILEEDNTLGALNMYSRKPAAFAPLDLAVLDELATHESITLTLAARLTTTDGTQYYFGETTNSAWTVPVFGADPGLAVARCHRPRQNSAEHAETGKSDRRMREMAVVTETIVLAQAACES